MSSNAQSPRPITGRTVLLAFVAFFTLIAGMNVYLLRAAVSTFGGVEVASAYRAGLAFNNEIAAAERQDLLGWTVDVSLARENSDRTKLVVRLLDADGKPVSGVAVAARLIHPADGRRDHAVTLHETVGGEFAGTSPAAPGLWDLLLEAKRADDTVYRSRSRLMLK